MITPEAKKHFINHIHQQVNEAFEAYLSKRHITLKPLESDWYRRVFGNIINDIVYDVIHRPENHLLHDPRLYDMKYIAPYFEYQTPTSNGATTHTIQLQEYQVSIDIGSQRFEHQIYIGTAPAIDRIYIRHGKVQPIDHLPEN